MKKISCFILMLIGVFCLVSCETNSSQSKYPTTLESFLVEGEDYIDHGASFDPLTYKLTYDENVWYENNLNELKIADPQIYYENGTYYITGTSDRDNSVIDIYTTTDFISYTPHLNAYNPSLYNGWENDNLPLIYAPEIYHFEGDNLYYMYYSAKDETTTPKPGGIRRNSVVVADNPLGPYRPLNKNGINGTNEPVFNDPAATTFDVLDISVFVDDDGKKYMYYSVQDIKNQHIIGVEMTSPYTVDWSSRVKLVIPGAKSSTNVSDKSLKWELYRNPPIAEAPFMIKSNGKYYLTYSVNGCWNKNYNVCYAVGDSPLGIFTKPYKSGVRWTNLLLGYPGGPDATDPVFLQWSGFASGTGHHCFFNVGDQVMIGYHAHQNRNWNKDEEYTPRYFAFDYLYFDKNGVPFCNGPTWSSPQPLPEELSGYSNIADGAHVYVENVVNKDCINDNYIVDCYNISGEGSKEVVLGQGYSYIEIDFGEEYTIGGISIYNSAFFNEAVWGIEYIDFGNGNAIYYPEFCTKFYNEDKEFIYPGSAFSFEFLKDFTSSKVVICFNLPDGGQINEIKVLGC